MRLLRNTHRTQIRQLKTMENQKHYLEQKAKMTAVISRLKRYNRYFIVGEIALFMLIVASVAIFAIPVYALFRQ